MRRPKAPRETRTTPVCPIHPNSTHSAPAGAVSVSPDQQPHAAGAVSVSPPPLEHRACLPEFPRGLTTSSG